MAWDHLSINQPHLVYIILGGFTSLFMLCSSFIKERLYIGESTVATLCGIIFGPQAANLINPLEWGNTDQITLEFSRVVLVVQCFAVGVELPKYYMEKHWRSVILLLLPVMTFGWLMTSLFIWWMINPLNWLDSLVVSACVTATDPVLASSVVGKGKFAKRIPKHLRDLLSAESGSNDGLAFPFLYLALYLIEFRPNAGNVAFHWFLITIIYECIFGAIYGFLIGYIGRHGIKYAEKHDLVDRESFLVFYFVLALFCAGSGSMMGVDDLLVGFCAGVGFSNDGWFTQKTEESHVSNVIDLLLNLTYFVYLGTIIPWEQYNNVEFGISPWRLVVVAIFVILFRRIPIMMMMMPFIPDIRTWREALFAGHFGPIGVGAIFVAILARAELETKGPTPVMHPDPEGEHYVLIWLIWPITTFLVISSILVHGSSIAVFTLGKRLNTIALTMSNTTAAGEDGPGWLNRLPGISSTSRSQAKSMTSETDENELKMENLPPGMLPPIGMPREFLRRQREEDTPIRSESRASSKNRREKKRKMKWDDSLGPGGPISQSAIYPQRRESGVRSEYTIDSVNRDDNSQTDENDQTLADEPKETSEILEIPLNSYPNFAESQQNSYVGFNLDSIEGVSEGRENDSTKGQIGIVSKDEKNNPTEPLTENDTKKDVLHNPPTEHQDNNKKSDVRKQKNEVDSVGPAQLKSKYLNGKRGPALAYLCGNTIILEDADGEVVKTYDLPPPENKQGSSEPNPVRQGVNKLLNWTGKKSTSEVLTETSTRQGNSRWGIRKNERSAEEEEEDDRRIRFTINGKGTRLTKEEFIRELQALDPKARFSVTQENDISKDTKATTKKTATSKLPGRPETSGTSEIEQKIPIKGPRTDLKENTSARQSQGNDNRSPHPSKNNAKKPTNILVENTKLFSGSQIGQNYMKKKIDLEEHETDAERIRREGVLRGIEPVTSTKGVRDIPRIRVDSRMQNEVDGGGDSESGDEDTGYEEETAAERKRREMALGLGRPSVDGYDSDDDDTLRVPPPVASRRGIRFAVSPERPKVSGS